MHTLDSDYDRFAEILLDEEKLSAFHSFDEICEEIGADPAALEKIIFEELGYYGDEILQCFQNLLDL